MFQGWTEKSYRAQAPKKLVAELDETTAPKAKRPARGRRAQ